MKIAILADIHGNLPALDAVLAEAEAAGADVVVANGDIADGPFPRETLDRLASLGDRWCGVRGNGDRWLVEAAEGRYAPCDPETDALILWASAAITPAQRAMLARLPLTLTIDHPRCGRLGFCHASGHADDEVVVVDSPLARFERCFSRLEAPTVFLGHTHMPFDRLASGRRVINTGSVGIPYGYGGAAWALVDRDVVLRRTSYDVEAAAARIAASGMPEAAAFVRDRVLSTPGDAEALDAFHAIAAAQDAALDTPAGDAAESGLPSERP